MLVDHANALLLHGRHLALEIGCLQGDVVHALTALREVLREEALRVDRFQQLDAEIVQIEDAGQRKIEAVDIAGDREPDMNTVLHAVLRMGSQFDFAPICVDPGGNSPRKNNTKIGATTRPCVR